MLGKTQGKSRACCEWIYCCLLLPEGQTRLRAYKAAKDACLHMNNWFISRERGIRSELWLFFHYGCKKTRKKICLMIVLLLNPFTYCFFSVCSCSLNEPPIATSRPHVRRVRSMFVRFCCREKSTAFDFWMPIERRHQLPAFGSHLKGEMFYVGLVLPACGDRHDVSVCPFLTVASGVPAELL